MCLLLFGVVAATAGVGHAEVGRPVARLTALVTGDGVRPGATARLVLRVELPDGLHVQSHAPRDPALVPTVLTLDAPAGVTIEEISYPAGVDLAPA